MWIYEVPFPCGCQEDEGIYNIWIAEENESNEQAVAVTSVN